MKKLIILLLLSSCSVEDQPIYPSPEPPKPYSPIANTDESVRKYVKEFKHICDIRPSSLCLSRWPQLESVTVVNIETLRKDSNGEQWAGVCWQWTDGNGKLVKASIQVLDDDGYGNKWNADSLRGLMFHELSHCLLDMDHTPSPESNPKMMNPFLYPTQIYIDNWDKMVEDVFAAADRKDRLYLLNNIIETSNIITVTAHPFYFNGGK